MIENGRVAMAALIAILLLLAVFSLVKAEAAVKPKPEGTLTVALTDLGEEGFLPDRNSGQAGPMWECVYDYLMYSSSSTGKPIPGVAERWEFSKDYRNLTFFLRRGIQFHDGWGELTAEDVKFMIELNSRPASSNVKKAVYQSIRSIDVLDRYTLVIHLKEPSSIFWVNFCDNVQQPIICKKYVQTVGEEKANRQPIGSGPYKLVEQKLGDYAKFEAFEDHWLLVPEFKYMVLRVVPEESTRVAMLKTGEIDIARELSIDRLSELEKAGLKKVLTQLSDCIFFPFGGMLLPEDKRYIEGYHRKDPWKDIRVREAMNIAIDRNAIVKTFYRGNATAAPIFWTLPGWEKLPPIPYDPAKAKKLLAEAGYPNGFNFKVYTHPYLPALPQLGEAAAGYWEAIGLKAEITRGDYATWRKTNISGKTAGWLWTHSNGSRDEWSDYLPGYEFPGASTPLWQSEETKTGIKKALTELDPEKREANFQDLARLYRSVYSHIPIVYAPKLHSAGKNVGEWYPGRTLHPKNFIFARHAKPLNTYRLFTP